MKKKIKYFIILFFCCLHISAQQELSEKASISIVTCGPGNELFSSFGHSAFRVHDPLIELDKIYNYGTFNFNAPNFYLNFAKGNMTYSLSTTKFVYFLQMYKNENRWVKAQELNLNKVQVQDIYEFLEINAKPANRDYQYDFFYDNCATIIEDVVKDVLKENVHFSNEHISTSKSHRDLIDDYAHNFKWGKFGIDFALGSVIDNQASKDDYKFLPDYIFEAFVNSTISFDGGTKPLVKSTATILSVNPSQEASSKQLPSPFITFLIISLLIGYITYINYRADKRSKSLDFLLYFITGLLGVAVLLLWFATTHTAHL